MANHVPKRSQVSRARNIVSQIENAAPNSGTTGIPPYIVEFRYHRRMTMDSKEGRLPSRSTNDGLDAAVALFRSLSDATRLAITRRLADGEARVADLVGELGLAQSTVSAHVACLRDCGLVVGRPEGRQVYYSLARRELLDLLAAAETLLAATGRAVALCPNYGAASAEVSGERG